MPDPGLSGAIPSALMAQAARNFHDKIALRYGEQSWTFAAFDAAADRLASGLARRIAPGERVIVLMANRPDYVLLQCAIERAGLVRVPVNARSTAHELGVILADCEPAVLFYDSTTADRVAAASGTQKALERAGRRQRRARWAELPRAERRAGRPRAARARVAR